MLAHPKLEPFDEGYAAARRGDAWSANAYLPNTVQADEWEDGYAAAVEEAQAA